MNEVINEFFTWEMLATYAGACVATGLVTYFIDKLFKNVPTQVVAYFVALVILLLANLFTGTLTLPSGILCVFNAVLVCGGTSGVISGARRLVKGKNENNESV